MTGKTARASVFGLLCVGVFLLVLGARVDYTASDSLGALLVSQSLLDHGTIRLDAYGEDVGRYANLLERRGEHVYYYPPLGTSVFAVPYVAGLNALGWRMPEHDQRAQRWLAAALAVVIFVLLFQIARLWLSFYPSALLAAAFWGGTSYASTMGTALWSHDLAAVFALAALWQVLRAGETGSEIRAAVLGALLFSAYLCRPTLAVLSPVLLLFVAVRDLRTAIRAALVVALLLAAFSLFSWTEFGELLPGYYMPKRLDGGRWSTAAWGNLFSPARGLFVFSPFLLLPLLMPGTTREGLRGRGPIAILLVWPILHWIAISNFPHWWGGYSYGPRFMSDVLPALYVFFVAFAAVALARSPRTTWLMVALLGWGVFAHTVQGLYNSYTVHWNKLPSIDETPERLFDWSDPPFLETSASWDARADRLDRNAVQARLATFDATVPVGERVSYDTSRVVFSGWWQAEVGYRWTRGHLAEILFRLPTGERPRRLMLDVQALGEQRVALELNDTKLLEVRMGAAESPPITIDVPAGAWTSDGLDVLRLRLPDACPPGPEDPRKLGVALRGFELSTSESGGSSSRPAD